MEVNRKLFQQEGNANDTKTFNPNDDARFSSRKLEGMPQTPAMRDAGGALTKMCCL